jgi:hypothetical protein
MFGGPTLNLPTKEGSIVQKVTENGTQFVGSARLPTLNPLLPSPILLSSLFCEGVVSA